MLITKQSLLLIVQTPTTVQIRTLTLNKSSFYHTIFKDSKKSHKIFGSCFLWFFFLSLCAWTYWFSQRAAKVVSKGYCHFYFQLNLKESQERPLLLISLLWATGQTGVCSDNQEIFLRVVLSHVTVPMFFFLLFLLIGSMVQGLQNWPVVLWFCRLLESIYTTCASL